MLKTRAGPILQCTFRIFRQGSLRSLTFGGDRRSPRLHPISIRFADTHSTYRESYHKSFAGRQDGWFKPSFRLQAGWPDEAALQ